MGIRAPHGGTGPEAGGNQQRSYWVVGAVLLGVVVVVLVGALVVDRTMRPRVGTEPLPGSGEQPDPAVIQDGTAALQRASDTTSPSSRTAVPAATPQTGEQGVEQAYLRYWDVYAAALLDLDDTRLGEVASADELRRIQDEIAGYRRAGYAVRVQVTHNYVIVDITTNDARLADEIVDRSFRVDPVTKNPPQGSDEGESIRDLFVLQRIDGIWKIVKSVRESG